jgi:ribosomal protein L25 (general stress protein Ctc)
VLGTRVAAFPTQKTVAQETPGIIYGPKQAPILVEVPAEPVNNTCAQPPISVNELTSGYGY